MEKYFSTSIKGTSTRNKNYSFYQENTRILHICGHAGDHVEVITWEQQWATDG